MKKVQLILRVSLSPLVFFISFLAMTVFPGPLALIMGGIEFAGRALGAPKDDFFYENTRDELFMVFCWITLPIYYTRNFILYANLDGD